MAMSNADNSDNQFGLSGYTNSTYGDSFADVYDSWYEHLDDDGFVDTIASLLPADGARVLELGVGTGRLLEQLRLRRPTVHDDFTGVDTSDKMLAVARAKEALAGCTLLQDDFSVTVPTGPFDVAFVGYNTLFNLATSEDIASCVELVASALRPGGRFVVDAVAPVSVDPGDHVGIRSMTTSEVVLTATRHDISGQRISGQFISFTEAGGVRLRPWSVRYLTPQQLDAIAESAGFTLESRTTDGVAPFAPDSPRHVSVYLLG